MQASNPGQFLFRAFSQTSTFAPLSGGWLSFYISGTTTFQAVYADAAQTMPLANPLQLDGNGQATFYLGAGLSYRIDLTDSNLVEQTGYPVDPVMSAQGLSAISAVTGSPNAIVLATVASMAYNSGLYIAFTPGASNTGTVTINAGAGSVNLMRNDGVALASGDLVANATYTALYNAVTGYFNLTQAVASQVQGWISKSALWATGGTAPAFTLTPAPAITSYTGSAFFVTFGANGTYGSNTLAVSGLAPIPLQQYNAAGTLIPATIVNNQTAYIVYNGTVFVVLSALPVTPQCGGKYKNLKVSYPQASSTATVTADELIVEDSSGNQTRLLNVNVSASLASSGAINGTDGSTVTVGIFYALYVAYNPSTGATGALISAGYPTPSTPISGYTQYARVAMNKVQSGTSWLPGNQANDEFQVQVGTYLVAMPLIASGTLGSVSTPTWQAETVRGNSSFVPPTASRVRGMVFTGVGGGITMMAPNSYYGANTSTTNPPLIVANGAYSGPQFDILLESNSIYVASSALAYFYHSGWKDNL